MNDPYLFSLGIWLLLLLSSTFPRVDLYFSPSFVVSALEFVRRWLVTRYDLTSCYYYFTHRSPTA